MLRDDLVETFQEHSQLVRNTVYQDKLYNNAKDRWRACPAGSAALVTLNEETALVVYHLPDGNGIDATWIRRVPRDSKEARERFE